jgi:hypothetical protein
VAQKPCVDLALTQRQGPDVRCTLSVEDFLSMTTGGRTRCE